MSPIKRIVPRGGDRDPRWRDLRPGHLLRCRRPAGHQQDLARKQVEHALRYLALMGEELRPGRRDLRVDPRGRRPTGAALEGVISTIRGSDGWLITADELVHLQTSDH